MEIGVAVPDRSRLGFGQRGVISGEIDKEITDWMESDDYDWAVIRTVV